MGCSDASRLRPTYQSQRVSQALLVSNPPWGTSGLFRSGASDGGCHRALSPPQPSQKRHEAWQTLQSRDNRRTVSEMALLLRLAVALDRRPEPVVKRLIVKVKDENLVLELVGKKADLDLSLEQWGLEGCAPILREVTGLNLKLKVQK